MVTVRVQPLHTMASCIPHVPPRSNLLFTFIFYIKKLYKSWAWHHLGVTHVPLVTRFYAVIKTMWRMQIQLLCVSVLYSMGSRVKPCPNMGIVTSHKSHGWNARFWLVERKFAALWLVSPQRGHHDYFCDWWISIRFMSLRSFFACDRNYIDGSQKRNCEGSFWTSVFECFWKAQ